MNHEKSPRRCSGKNGKGEAEKDYQKGIQGEERKDGEGQGKKMGSFKHGYYGTRTYRSWVAMKQRCLNPNNIGYPEYGLRGISICADWMVFEGFLKDMGERPIGHTLDRIDGSKGYSAANCRWASNSDQSKNRPSMQRKITICGEEFHIMDAVKRFGLPWRCLNRRLKRGLSDEELIAPAGAYRHGDKSFRTKATSLLSSEIIKARAEFEYVHGRKGALLFLQRKFPSISRTTIKRVLARARCKK